MTEKPDAYVRRVINVSIRLGQGSYGASGGNTVKLTGHRVVASIQQTGMPGAALADVRVYGMTQSVMNQLTRLGVPLTDVRQNTMTIEAGDAHNGMAVVYTGMVRETWQNLDAMPDTFLSIFAVTGAFEAMKPIPPTTFDGVADVATLMLGITKQMPRNFENNGVDIKLPNPYFPGTAKQQAEDLALAAHIDMFDDGDTLAIWPKDAGRKGVVPLISPGSGLIGYPQWTEQGMRFRCLFNPSIRFGGFIKMQSSIVPANKHWWVNGLTYNLSSELVNGPWFCDVTCVLMPGDPAP